MERHHPFSESMFRFDLKREGETATTVAAAAIVFNSTYIQMLERSVCVIALLFTIV